MVPGKFYCLLEYRNHADRFRSLSPHSKFSGHLLSPYLTNALYQNVSVFCNGDIELSVILNTPADDNGTVRRAINSSTNEHTLSLRLRALRRADRKSVDSNRELYQAVYGRNALHSGDCN